MKSALPRISIRPSDPLKSATSSKLKSEVWGPADGNDSLSIVSLEKWAKMSFLLFLILMAIEVFAEAFNYPDQLCFVTSRLWSLVLFGLL